MTYEYFRVILSLMDDKKIYPLSLSRLEKEILKNNADKLGMTISKYIKFVLFKSNKSTTLDDIKNKIEESTLYILRSVKEKNNKIESILDFISEFLNEEENMFDKKNRDKNKLPETNIIDKLIDIIDVKIMALKSESEAFNNENINEKNKRDFAVKILENLRAGFIEIKGEVF